MVLGAMLASGLGIAGHATATPCGGVAVDPRFREAAALCHGGIGDPATSSSSVPAGTPTIQSPVEARSVSIAMPGARSYRPHAVRGRAAIAQQPGNGNALLVAAISRHYRIDPHLFASMMRQESGGRQDAVSGKGALGLMQVMPATARSVGVSDPKAMLTNPVLAMSAGAVYLKRLQAKFGNDVPLVLAAYNAGPGAVMKAGRRIPRYRETQGYVGAILQRWQRTRQGR
jgi:soluble lytic murein transglycosylase-like protein